MEPKRSFLDECREWWRLASVKLAALVAAASGLITANPDVLFGIIALIPTSVPVRIIFSLGVAGIVFFIPLVARLWPQNLGDSSSDPDRFARVVSAGAPKKSLAAAAVAAMVVIATPFVGGWEGKRNSPYLDAVGVETVCYGETRVEMKTYTDEECRQMLAEALRQFGEQVAELSPGIEASPYEWAAHTSFAYNIGTAAYARSSVRRLFNEGRRAEACRFMERYKYAGGRVLAGLVYRRSGDGARIGEAELCMTGVIMERHNV